MQTGFNVMMNSKHLSSTFRVFKMVILLSSTGLGCKEGDKELPVTDVAADLFYYHPSCQAETKTTVSSTFILFRNFITKTEEEVLKKEVDPHLKRLKYEFDHWDDVRIHFSHDKAVTTILLVPLLLLLLLLITFQVYCCNNFH